MSGSSRRLDALTRSFDDLRIDAMLVTEETNVRYLSGFTGDSSFLLVKPTGTTILSDGRYDAQIDAECDGLEKVIRPPSQLISDLTRQVLNDQSRGMRVGIEADHISLAAYRYLDKHCQGIELVETAGAVEKLRMVKDAEEIATTKSAVRVAERAFESLLPMMTRDRTEREIAHDLEAKMRFLGAEGCSFAPIVAAGAAGALPHYSPTDAKIGDAATILIDWGARFQGYASDLTRTLHRPGVSKAFCRAYEAVLDAQLAAIDAVAPGVAASDVDATARGVLDRAGLGDAFKHGLGHGTGLEIHEMPRMSSSSEETLVSGMIVTVEPGVYLDGDFGIRIEDDVLITDSGREVLSRLPKGLDDCRLML